MKGNTCLIFIGLLFLSACYDEDFADVTVEQELKPTFAAPIGKSKMMLKTYIEKVDTSLKEYEDGLLYFLLQKDIYSLKADDFITIPDITTPSVEQSFPTGTFFFSDSIVVDDSIANRFNAPDDDMAYIDEILLDSANLNITVGSQGIAPAELRLTFHKIIKDGAPLSIDILIKAETPDVIKNIPLEKNDRLLFTNPVGNNSFPVSFTLAVYKGSRESLSGTISFSSSITNINFQQVKGYMGRFAYTSGLSSIHLDIYDNLPEEIESIPDDTKFIEDPELRLYLDNSIGIPLFVYFPALTFASGNSGKSVEVSGDKAPKVKENGLAINYPQTNGITEKTSIILNKDNSNIDLALHLLPDDMQLQAGVYVNKDGYTERNFVSDSGKMDLAFEFEMPISAKIPSFRLRDTIPFSFSDVSDDLDMIEFVEIKLIISNGFPTSAGIQAYLANGRYELLDSLIAEDKTSMESGKLDANGTVMEAASSDIVVYFDKQTIQKLDDTEYMIVTGEITTGTSGEWVKFYSHYSLEAKISVKTQLQILE